MIKINLLPPHILEGRRVKLVAAAMGLLLAVVVVAMAGWIWFAPAPLPCLTRENSRLTEELDKVTRAAEAVTATANEAAAIESSYKAKQSWVGYVAQADKVPTLWVKWYQRINRYIPSEVALSSLPVPTNAMLTLSGSTSDFRAANRWYLNMLRCDMVDLGSDPAQAVQLNVSMPGQVDAPGSGDNPRMAFPVSLSVALNPQYLDFLNQPAVPEGMSAGGGGGRGGGGGGGGGRMGGGGGRGGGGGGGGRGGGGGGRGGGGGGMGRGGGGRGGRGG
jgi:Tfp pilus assembly protein PilN